MTFTTPDTIPQPPVETPSLNGDNPQPNYDAFHAQLAAEVTEAETELGRDQKTLDAARAAVVNAEKALARAQASLEAAKGEVPDPLAKVRFVEMKLASRQKSLDTFDRLRAKANR